MFLYGAPYTVSKLAFARNLLKCKSDFKKKITQLSSEQAKSYVALAVCCRCLVPAAE